MTARKYISNPFILDTNIPNEYFCDREKETEKIISYIENGNNVVLSAPRRLGKTSMLYHILNDRTIKTKYNTILVDLYNTNSPEDFIDAFYTQFRKSNFSSREAKRFEKIRTETRLEFGIDLRPLRYSKMDTITYKQIADNIIDRMFDFFSQTSKPNIIVFDEFQQIEQYEQKITPLLRTKIQTLGNTRFIFSGSSMHMLDSMFNDYNNPFYDSATQVGLRPIPSPVYADFCSRMFRKFGKRADEEITRFAYPLFYGITLNLQQLFNKIFALTPDGGTADLAIAQSAILEILDEREQSYQLLIHDLSEKEKNLLLCIAQQGLATNLMSAGNIRDYGLGSASSIQTVLRKLTNGDRSLVIKGANSSYMLRDKYLELWLSRESGTLQHKLVSAPELYEEFLQLQKPQIPLRESPEK